MNDDRGPSAAVEYASDAAATPGRESHGGMERPPARAPPLEAEELLALLEGTLREWQAGAPGLPAVGLDSVLDRDLGLDSLARTELLSRIEQAFAIRLPDETLVRAETVGDLLRAAHQARRVSTPLPARRPAVGPPPAAAAPGGASAEATPADARTLLEALDWHVRAHPGREHLRCLPSAEGEREQAFTYRQMADAGAALAAGLQHLGVLPRQGVAIMLPTSPEYFAVYVGILRAGAIPVPIYPPARATQLEEHVLRHAGILDNARATVLVTVPEAMGVARLLQARVAGLRHVVAPQQLAARSAELAPVALRGEDIAFIQYTSGSTGSPKGVALTHANLLANIRAMEATVQASPRDIFVSWLPLYHDMGLIGAWLGGLYVGYPLVVMSPLAFLARPERWLQAIDRHRGTLSAAPNFAFELRQAQRIRRLVGSDAARRMVPAQVHLARWPNICPVRSTVCKAGLFRVGSDEDVRKHRPCRF